MMSAKASRMTVVHCVFISRIGEPSENAVSDDDDSDRTTARAPVTEVRAEAEAWRVPVPFGMLVFSLSEGGSRYVTALSTTPLVLMMNAPSNVESSRRVSINSGL